MSQSVPESNESLVTLSYLNRDYQINIDQLKHLCETTGSENESEIKQWLEDNKITDCQTMLSILDLAFVKHLIDLNHYAMFTSAASVHFARGNQWINPDDHPIDKEKLQLPPVANITADSIDREFALFQEDSNNAIFKAKMEKRNVLKKLKWSAVLHIALVIISVYLLWLIQSQNRQIHHMKMTHHNYVVEVISDMNYQCDERLNYMSSKKHQSRNLLLIDAPIALNGTDNRSLSATDQLTVLKTKVRILEEIVLWSMAAIGATAFARGGQYISSLVSNK